MRDAREREPLLRSFFMGGFECSTHRNNRGKRLDLIASTRHDEFAEADYARLIKKGIRTARDGVRWHLIEKEPFRYDFSSLNNQIAAAKNTGIQVIWDYFHYGFPDDLDIYSPDFIERFASFSSAVTRFLIEQLGPDLIVCPVNEISFFSWIAGDQGMFHPCSKRRGNILKRQLVRTALASVDAIRSMSPAVRWMFTDPAIHVISRSSSAKRAAENYRRSQFHAFDMLIGRHDPELGGDPKYLDIIGLNYYFHNQWWYPSRRKIPLGHKFYRPLNEILNEYRKRYGRPIMIAETGIEDDERASWLSYVGGQVQTAIESGLPVIGICLYPIVNHPGWADNRHCHNGLWDYADDDGSREVYQPLADELAAQINAFDSMREHDVEGVSSSIN
jgi:beta-glucosidase/6-phospho-beta-glucosidase/beta-galactosidase